MHCSQIDVAATALSAPSGYAQTELNSYLEEQAALIAPEIPALVPAPITVERVGFTRNASQTPYIVYRVRGNSRCSRFIKRRHFMEIVQAFLVQVSGNEERILSIKLTHNCGFSIRREGVREFMPYTVINTCFEQFNNTRLPVTPQFLFPNSELRIKVGDCVRWIACPPLLSHLEYWSPFRVLEIKNGLAKLEMLSYPLPVSELERCA